MRSTRKALPAGTLRSPAKATPVRAALTVASVLRTGVQDGLGAMKSDLRHYIEDSQRMAFGDSLDLDEAMRPGREQENRWDYLLGHAPSGAVVGLEPHSAKDDEVYCMRDVGAA